MAKSKIVWTDETWDPIPPKVESPPADGAWLHGRNLEEVYARQELLERWKKPRRVWIDPSNDLLHERVEDGFVRALFLEMALARHHQFHIATRRTDRLLLTPRPLAMTPNVWVGACVENRQALGRVRDLLRSRAVVKFLSLDPLLEPMPDLDLTGIDWIRIGGEAGPKARRTEESWVLDIRDQCLAAGVPFFFRGWGNSNPRHSGRRLEGREWREYPPEPVAGQKWRGPNPPPIIIKWSPMDSAAHRGGS